MVTVSEMKYKIHQTIIFGYEEEVLKKEEKSNH